MHQAADRYEALRDILPTVPVTDVAGIVQIAPILNLQPMSKAAIQALQTLGEENLINQACLAEFEKGISQVALMRSMALAKTDCTKQSMGRSIQEEHSTKLTEGRLYEGWSQVGTKPGCPHTKTKGKR